MFTSKKTTNILCVIWALYSNNTGLMSDILWTLGGHLVIMHYLLKQNQTWDFLIGLMPKTEQEAWSNSDTAQPYFILMVAPWENFL